MFFTTFLNETIYAQFCTGLTNLTTATGSINDGSGSANYNSNTNCTWLIQPAGNPANITFTMDTINLGFFQDRVRVYDGTSAAGTLIATYTRNNLGNTAIANSGSMFIQFTTDGFNNAQGWAGSYTSARNNCQPNTILTTNTGAFTDGTRNGFNYANNTNCEWLIQPTTLGLFVEVDFSRFNVATGDSVILYDGSNASAPVITALTGNINPGIYQSSGGSLFVRFITGNSIVSNGWRIVYNSQTIPLCTGLTVLNSLNGLFDDGSPSLRNYVENSNCQWLIQPTGAVSVDLQFNYFSTEANFDFVTVYQGTNNNGVLLGSFSGNTLPPSVKSTTGSMFVEFNTDNNTNRTGWEANFTSTNVSTITAAIDTIYLNAGNGSLNSFQVTANASWTTSDNQSWLISSPINGNGNQTINLLAIQGNIGPERTAQLYINALTGIGGDTVTVIQRSSGRFLDIPADTLFFPALNPSSQSFNLLANVSWTLTKSSPWISLTPLNGSNNSNPQVSISDNSSNQIRSGYIVASGTQNAGNDTIYIQQDSLPQSFSVSPKNILLSYNTGSFDSILVNANLNWVLTHSASWLTTSASSGNDSTYVTITSNSANLTFADRSTYIYFDAGNGRFVDSVLITQKFHLRNFSVSPKNRTLSYASGSSDSVQVNANLNWVLTSAASWLTTSTSSGSDSANITITANSANLTFADRSAYIYFDAGNGRFVDSVLITQEFLLRTFSVSPNNLTLNSTTGSLDIVQVYANLDWTLSNSATWLSTNVTSGNDSATVTITANSAPPTIADRSSYVYFNAGNGRFLDSVLVTQRGILPFLVGSPDTVLLSMGVGEVATFNISASSNWNITSASNWLTLNKLNGAGNDIITASTSSINTTNIARIAELYLTDVANNLKDTLIVIQGGRTGTISVSPSSINLASLNSSSAIFQITSDVTWSITGVPGWLNLSASSGMNNGSITVTANSANQSGVDRVVTLLINGLGSVSRSVRVTQLDISSNSFLLSVDTLFVGNTTGSLADFTVIANSGWSLTETSFWLALNKTSGTNTEIVTARAGADNLFGSPRLATVTASSTGNPDRTLVVVQAGAPLSFSYAPDSLVIGADSASFGKFNLTSNLSAWTVSESENWMKVSPGNGSVTDEITVTATKSNNTGIRRSGIVTISSPPFVPLAARVIQDTVRSIGLKERTLEQQVSIYPNPSEGVVNLKLKNGQDLSNAIIEVYDIIGKSVSCKVDIITREHLAFNFSELDKGFYFIRITIGEESFAKKILLTN